MTATCFIVHECTISASPYSSYLDGSWVDTDYPEFTSLPNPYNVDDIEDLNWIDTPSSSFCHGIQR